MAINNNGGNKMNKFPFTRNNQPTNSETGRTLRDRPFVKKKIENGELPQYRSGLDRYKNKGLKYKEKRKKQAKEGVKKVASTYGGPLGGLAADAFLNTKRGQRYLDAYANANNDVEGLNNVKKEINKDKRKFKIMIGLAIIIILFLPIIIIVSSKADSQKFSNENGSTYESDDYIDDKNVNIFMSYPGLYEKIVKVSNEVSDKYKIEIDKDLIVATLVGTISNDLVRPVNDGSCGEEECYYFNGEPKTWTEFLESWGDQVELLAKMQILTFTNPNSKDNASCSSEKTMEQIADNDMEVRRKYAFWWLNPVEWFRGFKDVNEAEFNAVCTVAPSGKTTVPTVTAQSILPGEYSMNNDINHEYHLEKKENSGGVYYWNLVNKNGFLYQYLKDYLSDEYKDDEEKNYEFNKTKIVSIANEIYSYYDTLKKTCDGYKVIESEIKTIKVYNPPEKQRQFGLPEYEEIDFEDQYVGGVMLAEFSSGGMEGLKAFAILVRSEAIALVGLDGSGTIENSSNAQNYNPHYDPNDSQYARITQAVRETRGMVLSKYHDPKVWHTEYDNFCPTASTPENGFFYLPKGQQSLPINIEKYKEITGQEFMKIDDKSFECPCVTEEEKAEGGAYSRASSPACWRVNDKTQSGYSYKSSGGHGRGASQHGIKYFAAFGYNQDAILRLFFPGAQVRIISSSLENNKCANIDYYTGEVDSKNSTSSNSSEYNGNEYTEAIGGQPLNMPIGIALSAKGHTIDELNSCIRNRVEKAGLGTREGVVEAGMALLECTMDLTGGYTYPYDHLGGDVLSSNPDLVNKYGINSRWGMPGGACDTGRCRLGLNCATYIRWSMCNGGMDLCDKGSRAAHEMNSTKFFPEAVKIKLSQGFQVLEGTTSISSAEEAYNSIKPGDVLYSENYPRDPNATNHGNHVMLVVGKTDSYITIAENGRKTSAISKSAILSSSNKRYEVLLLDEYYANTSNRNNIS